MIASGCSGDSHRKDRDVPSSLFPGINWKINKLPHSNRTRSVSLKLVLPKECAYDSSNLKLHNPASGDMEFTRMRMRMSSQGSFLDPVCITNDKGKTILLSLIGEDGFREISSSTTAKTLVYLFPGIFTTHSDRIPEVLKIIGNDPEVKELQRYIDGNLKTGNDVFDRKNSDFVDQLAKSINSVLKTIKPLKDKIEIEPPGKSISPKPAGEIYPVNKMSPYFHSGLQFTCEAGRLENTQQSWSIDLVYMFKNYAPRTMTIAVVPIDESGEFDFNRVEEVIIPSTNQPPRITYELYRHLITDTLSSFENSGFSYTFRSDEFPSARIYILGEGINTLRQFSMNREDTLLKRAIIRSFAYDYELPFLLTFFPGDQNSKSMECVKNHVESLVDMYPRQVHSDYKVTSDICQKVMNQLDQFINYDPCFEAAVDPIPGALIQSLREITGLYVAALDTGIIESDCYSQLPLDNFSYIDVSINGEQVDEINAFANANVSIKDLIKLANKLNDTGKYDQALETCRKIRTLEISNITTSLVEFTSYRMKETPETDIPITATQWLSGVNDSDKQMIIDYLSDILKRGERENIERYYELTLDVFKLAEPYPESIEQVSYLHGLALHKTKTHTEAILYFTEYINSNPDSAEAYNYRGECYMMTEQYNEALTDFDKALDINPDLEKARRNRTAIVKIISIPNLPVE